jgi:hypothetical protein
VSTGDAASLGARDHGGHSILTGSKDPKGTLSHTQTVLQAFLAIDFDPVHVTFLQVFEYAKE